MGAGDREGWFRIAAWMLLVMSAGWGLNLGTWNTPAWMAYMPAWMSLTYVLFDSVQAASKWAKLQDALIKGARKAKAEYDKNQEVARGIAEIVNEQARKK